MVEKADTLVCLTQAKTKVEANEPLVTENPIQLSLFDQVAEGHSETIKRTPQKLVYWQASIFGVRCQPSRSSFIQPTSV